MEEKRVVKRLPVSLITRKATARIFVSNLIITDHKKVLFLTGFGPTQEIRAFAHILNDGKGDMKASLKGENVVRVFEAKTFYAIRLVNLGQGYHGIHVVPDNSYIVGDTREECFEIYSRILSQKEFVHRDWYEDLFGALPQIEPSIGSKVCFQNSINVEAAVKEGINEGLFKFPVPTAHLTLEQANKEGSRNG